MCSTSPVWVCFASLQVSLCCDKWLCSCPIPPLVSHSCLWESLQYSCPQPVMCQLWNVCVCRYQQQSILSLTQARLKGFLPSPIPFLSPHSLSPPLPFPFPPSTPLLTSPPLPPPAHMWCPHSTWSGDHGVHEQCILPSQLAMYCILCSMYLLYNCTNPSRSPSVHTTHYTLLHTLHLISH